MASETIQWHAPVGPPIANSYLYILTHTTTSVCVCVCVCVCGVCVCACVAMYGNGMYKTTPTYVSLRHSNIPHPLTHQHFFHSVAMDLHSLSSHGPPLTQ